MSAGLYYLSHISVGGTYWVDVFPGLLVMAMGMGIMFISITIAATSGVPHRESGLASGILNTSQQLGGALGLAILSGVATAGIKSYTSSHAASAHSQLTMATAQVHGYHNALLVGAGFTLLASLSAATLVKHYRVNEDQDAAIHV
jgi:hypothetical protein